MWQKIQTTIKKNIMIFLYAVRVINNKYGKLCQAVNWAYIKRIYLLAFKTTALICALAISNFT